jgi:hypothetical protein
MLDDPAAYAKNWISPIGGAAMLAPEATGRR